MTTFLCWLRAKIGFPEQKGGADGGFGLEYLCTVQYAGALEAHEQYFNQERQVNEVKITLLTADDVWKWSLKTKVYVCVIEWAAEADESAKMGSDEEVEGR